MRNWQEVEQQIRRLGLRCPPGTLKPPVDEQPQTAYRSADDLHFERWQADAFKHGGIVRRGIGQVLGVR